MSNASDANRVAQVDRSISIYAEALRWRLIYRVIGLFESSIAGSCGPVLVNEAGVSNPERP